MLIIIYAYWPMYTPLHCSDILWEEGGSVWVILLKGLKQNLNRSKCYLVVSLQQWFDECKISFYEKEINFALKWSISMHSTFTQPPFKNWHCLGRCIIWTIENPLITFALFRHYRYLFHLFCSALFNLGDCIMPW